MSENSNWLLQEFDADKWAKEFMKIFGSRLHEIDEDLMRTWFACAIMTGHDHALRRQIKEPRDGNC